MKYYGVIVDTLTRSTSLIDGEYDHKPDKEFASAFCFCKWFPVQEQTEIGMLCAELLQLQYEILIIQMFRKLDVESPSKFADYAREIEA